MGEFVLRLNYFLRAFRNRFRGLKKVGFKISISPQKLLKGIFCERHCVLKCSVLFVIDILKENQMNSHFTFNSAAFDVSFPSLLLATHLYSPLSFLFTFVIVKTLLTTEKLILESFVIADSSLVHDVVGNGFAVELQEKVTFPPSFVFSLLG